MKCLILLKSALLVVILSFGQLNGQVPPRNPYLIDSPFPFVHQNNYRQGYSQLPALGLDAIEIRLATPPDGRVSPWLLLSERYPDGSRTIWGCSSTHIWKAQADENGLNIVRDRRIDTQLSDRSWSFLMLPNGRVLTSDDNLLLLYREANPNNPTSPILLEREVAMPPELGAPVKLNRMYDGNITFATNPGFFALLSPDLELLDTYELDLQTSERAFGGDETAFHNDYASDELGGIFLVTTKRMIRLQVADNEITKDWEVPMDFGGNVLQGVGTTPTLLGTNDDRLVCIVNSKSPAEVIVFWRDHIPSDWEGLPGMDRRVAAIVSLPGSSPISNTFAAVENSPVAYGYGIACAQYNGFIEQGCPTAKGLYKLQWDPASNSMNLQWRRNDINLNNVLMYSRPDNLIYGSGRENDCDFYYYGIDWNTGNTVKRFRLGAESYLDDPGDANIILEDGSILFNTRDRLIQLYPKNTVTDLDAIKEEEMSYLVFPNPFVDQLQIKANKRSSSDGRVSLFNLSGKLIAQQSMKEQRTLSMDLPELVNGVYLLKIEDKDGLTVRRIVKQDR
ncbi:MAG: T9SS type A sorting domain-containing protein [Saprospiraceae bacterium]|nr:T9SS type A sorting domain-containing protein [Saprospiraceae bacterium]